MNILLENIDELNAVLKLTVEKNDYEKRVDDVLKDYRKKANMPGFRPGKVPTGLIKKMYGTSVLVDEINKIVSEELSKYLQSSELNILGEPLPSETQETIDFDTQESFDFSFDLGLSPEVEVKLSKRDKINYYTIEVNDDMLEAQVKQAIGRFGTNELTEIMADKTMAKGDFVQLDTEGKALEGGIASEGSVLSLSIVKEEEKEKFLGAKNGDVIVLNPKVVFTGVNEITSVLKVEKEIAEIIDGDFQFTITELTDYVDAELNQELFDQVLGKDVVSSEEEFKAKIKEDLEKTLLMESEYKFMLDAKEKLMKKIKIDLPEVFLKKWFTTVNRDKPEITEEQIDNDMPQVLDDLRWQLVKNQIMKTNELKVEEADIVESAKKTAKMQFMQYGLSNIPEEHLNNYAQDMMKQEEQLRNFSEAAAQEKILGFIKEAVKIEDQQLSREDFNKLFEKK